jgi:hypothetical protein
MERGDDRPSHRLRRHLLKRVLLLTILWSLATNAQEYTRGVGVYPGDPREDFSPSMRIDADTYRNLALRRPAYQSSAYDYNLTAQLVTDGIRDTRTPWWIATSTSNGGALSKHERETLFDRNWVTTVALKGRAPWIQVELGGTSALPEIDRLDVSLQAQESAPPDWSCTLSGSDDGQAWHPLGSAHGAAREANESTASIRWSAPAHSRFYRVAFASAAQFEWRASELKFFRGDRRVEPAGPHHFSSAWKSAGAGEEWVYVDLGAVCTFDRVALYWIRRAAAGAIEVSGDAAGWSRVAALPSGPGLNDDLKLAAPASGRYVRVLMTQPASAEGYILSELEVYGKGGPVPVAKPRPEAQTSGRMELAGGNWRVERDAPSLPGGAALSKPGFRDDDWVIATVPGTVLASFLNAGALPDPNYGDNQVTISDSFFYSDFWYRTEFTGPSLAPGRHLWLNFAGVNWKAEIYLNGEKLGRIEGGFLRGRFDVTALVAPGRPNALAVRIEKNATPGIVKEKNYDNPDMNGGALGADNPTYHASIGWDWIPTIRGRNTGIWAGVSLTTSGAVTMDNPFVSTALPLPDLSRADVSVEVALNNHEARSVSGTLRGRFGDAAFTLPVTLDASAAKTVKLNPATTPALRLANPKLWWPNGYGDPNLYHVELSFEENGHGVSDATAFEAGVRQFAYSEEGGALRLWINGRRFVPRGGNWGFGESMLRYRAREYDTAARYHRAMNFTMVRNWVGQIGDDAFYEACDRHGIVVWQDFWLANPWDGPDPDNNELFMTNARDMVLRIRNHASIGLYCGRNEGYPPKPLDDGIRQLLASSHPGLHYISSSADDVVSGHGPYWALPPKYYFAERATPKLHSEIGMPNIVTMDSLRAMMPEQSMWPQGRMWGLHDFCLNGAQKGASFLERIEKSYGAVNNVTDWVSLAQFVDYEGHRGMFESGSKNRMGVLIWMSHPAWPSLVWQTYDYYFETGAGYFGSRKGAEPLHIQWNPVTDNIEVVNYSGGAARGLTARVELLASDGSLQWERTATLDSAEDSLATAVHMEYPASLTPVHFLRMKLTRGAELVSENFYWRGTEEGNYQALRKLPAATVESETAVARQNGVWRLTTRLRNTSKTPALMVRVKAVRETTGDRILPVLYSDNYVALMPGETRTIITEVKEADTRAERPRITLEGFNLAAR